MPDDLYARALARLDALAMVKPLVITADGKCRAADAFLELLRALLVERQARFTTLGHEEDSAKAATQRALHEFVGGGDE